MSFDQRWKVIDKMQWNMEQDFKNLEKKFDSDPVFGDKYLKNETKPYNKKITTNFNGYLMMLAQHCVIL